MREKWHLPVWHKGLSQDAMKHEDTTVSLTGIHTNMIQELNRKRQSSSNSITEMTWNQACKDQIGLKIYIIWRGKKPKLSGQFFFFFFFLIRF